MTAPFAPVAFPVFRTKRTSHPTSSCSSSSNSGSSPSDGVPWVKGPVSPGAPPGLPRPGPGPDPDRLSGSREGAEGSPFLQDGVSKDCWMERPVTPTLLGYEIMEERAKFTVYKVLVTGSKGDSWVIFRRYADFSRLNDKLKEIFPRFHLGLPPKRWFKDNYDMEFLEERQIGLQSFLQNLIGHKDIVSSEVVRQFLCLDDPRSPFDSLEESRAFCETLEETNHRLHRALLEKQKEIDHLKRLLQERGDHIKVLEKKSNVSLSPESSGRLCPSTVGSESNIFTEQNTDQQRVPGAGAQREDVMDPNDEGQQHREEEKKEDGAGGGCSAVEAKEESRSVGPGSKNGACWSTLVIAGSPVHS